jgi:outer membrane lipoprotein
MNRKLISFFLLGLLFCRLLACAPVPIRTVEDRGGTTVPFAVLLANPQAFTGKLVIIGGYVLETANNPEGSILTVLQAPLDYQKQPGDKDRSAGRFLVRIQKFLDPEVYSKERKVTVGGQVAGVRPKQVDGAVYDYPLIDSQEIYLWSKEEPLAPYPYGYHWFFSWGYPYFCF